MKRLAGKCDMDNKDALDKYYTSIGDSAKKATSVLRDYLAHATKDLDSSQESVAFRKSMSRIILRYIEGHGEELGEKVMRPDHEAPQLSISSTFRHLVDAIKHKFGAWFH